MIRSIGIIAKPRQAMLARVIPELLEWLEQRQTRALMDLQTMEGLEPAVRASLRVQAIDRKSIADQCDLLLVLGGDGTLLSAARHILDRNIPILAVNLGGLGFLTAVPMEKLYSTLELVLKGEHQVESRKMLQVEVIRPGYPVETHHALNDAVINKVAIARILDFQASVNGEFLSSFKADGLIVSTPTGSTAYSLAAGGPIVYPSVDAFVITPICPHTLTNRPLVVSDRSRIEITLMNETESVYLTVDGQVGLEFHTEDRIVCSLSPHQIGLVYPPNNRFFEVLRSKLKWGER